MPESTVFLSTDRLNLVLLNKEKHLPYFLKWFNDGEVVRNLSMPHYPVYAEREGAFMDDMMKSVHDLVLVMELKEDGRPIGVMGLHKIHYIHQNAETGTVIGEKEDRRKGYATEAKNVLLRYAFHTMNLRKVCSAYIAFNEASKRYGEKCGYVEEGRRREQYFRDGKWWDLVLTRVFREDWESMNQ